MFFSKLSRPLSLFLDQIYAKSKRILRRPVCSVCKLFHVWMVNNHRLFTVFGPPSNTCLIPSHLSDTPPTLHVGRLWPIHTGSRYYAVWNSPVRSIGHWKQRKTIWPKLCMRWFCGCMVKRAILWNLIFVW